MRIEFNNQNKTYPVVLIPDKILISLNRKLSYNEIASELEISKPEKKFVKKPNKPSKYASIQTQETKTEANGCMIIFVLLISVGVGSIADTFIEGLGLTLLIFILEVFGFWVAGLSLIKFKKQTKSKSFERNPDLLKKLELSYEKELKRFTSDSEEVKKNYHIELNEFFKKVKTNKIEIKKKLHAQKLNPSTTASRGEPSLKRGLAELKFLEQLDNELKGSVFIDMVPKLDWAKNKNSYNPDFTLICKLTNLHIDIEIDEPYTIKDKTPIHYIDSLDGKRNDFFMDINWCLIRFSERQIIKNTPECISTIKSVYKNIIEMKTYYATNLTQESRWTYEESFIMLNNQYREKYLYQ